MATDVVEQGLDVLTPPGVSGGSQRWENPRHGTRPSKYSEELRERAVRMVAEVSLTIRRSGQRSARLRASSASAPQRLCVPGSRGDGSGTSTFNLDKSVRGLAQLHHQESPVSCRTWSAEVGVMREPTLPARLVLSEDARHEDFGG